MIGLQVGVNGRGDLQKKLDALKKSASKEQLEKALLAGGEVFKRAIQDGTPVREDLPSGTALPPGALREDIHVVLREGNGNTVSVTVGPGPKTALDMSRLEMGHQVVTRGKSGSHTTGERVPAYPVMRPAYEASRDQAMEAVIQSLRDQEGG